MRRGSFGGGLMCTVSWLQEEDGFQLLCNRDEKRTRAIAAAPAVEWMDRVQVLAPRDEAGGGTWIAVNEYGVAVTLLNGAPIGSVEKAGAFRLSRGLVLQQLATARTATEVCERAWRMELGLVAPFTVAALEPGMPAAIVEWNGSDKGIIVSGGPLLPLSSSSFDATGAQRARREEFSRVCGALPCIEDLLTFHRSHQGAAGASGDAYSTCMHRADAETVSFSWIRVTRTAASFHYQPGAPCRQLRSVAVDLALRA
jgi:hypothetical protein